jgi:hypothetical protein
MQSTASTTMRQVILFLACIGLWSVQANAQSLIRKTEKSNNNQNYRIWYGGNVPFGLGFGTQTLVQLGVSPMIGYKITPELSVGPRVGFIYSYYSYRNPNTGQVLRTQPTTWSAGVFARYKFVRQFFAHAEYEYQNLAVPYYVSNGFQIQRYKADNINLGIGLLQGGSGSLQSEILLLYNVNPSIYSTQSPITIRFGLNWHF